MWQWSVLCQSKVVRFWTEHEELKEQQQDKLLCSKVKWKTV